MLIVTKARDNRLIKLTRELALYLMLKHRRGSKRGLVVCVIVIPVNQCPSISVLIYVGPLTATSTASCANQGALMLRASSGTIQHSLSRSRAAVHPATTPSPPCPLSQLTETEKRAMKANCGIGPAACVTTALICSTLSSQCVFHIFFLHKPQHHANNHGSLEATAQSCSHLGSSSASCHPSCRSL